MSGSIEVGSAYISILPSTDKLAPGIRKALGAADADVRKEGEKAGDSYGGGFRDKLKAAVGIGAGVLVGAGLTDGFSQALDQGALNAKLGASLGLSSAESARAGKVAGDLYKNNFGDSVETVNEGIKSVIANIDGMRGASESTLTRISAKVLNTADVFDQDLGGVTRGVSQLMRTGLAKNASQALDILTSGFQNGADKSEDFLDTLNEYGTQFRKLGLNGKAATGLLVQGLKAGARDGDLVADSLKEFSIRAIDGSATTKAGFDALGLSASGMAEKIGKGGKSASAGLGETLTRLRAIKDPVKQSQAAVALFGTQAEDLGQALYALHPETAAKGLGKVAGSAKRASDAVGNTPDAQIKTFTRTLRQGFVEVIGGQVIPKLVSFSGFLKENKGTLTAVGLVVAPLVAAFATYVGVVKVISLVTRGWAIAQGLLNGQLLLNPIGLVVAAIAALVIGLVIAYRRSETFRKVVNGAFAGVKAVAAGVAHFFTSTIPAAFGVVADKAKAVGGAIKKTWNDVLGFVKGLPGKISRATSGMWDGIKNAFRAAINWLIGKWNGLHFSIPSIDTHIPGVGKVGGFTLGTPDIPLLAKGGVLTKATLNIAGEAGPEAVTPLSYLDDRIAKVARAASASAQAAPGASRLSGRLRLVVDGQEFSAYVDDRAGSVYDGQTAFSRQIGRMQHA